MNLPEMDYAICNGKIYKTESNRLNMELVRKDKSTWERSLFDDAYDEGELI